MNELMTGGGAKAFLADLQTEIQNVLDDLVVPTEEEISRLYTEAQAQGCGLSVEDGKPGTLQVSPGAPVGTLIIYKPDALLGRDQ